MQVAEMGGRTVLMAISLKFIKLMWKLLLGLLEMFEAMLKLYGITEMRAENFRETLQAIVRGIIAEIVKPCIKSSPL